MNLLIEIGAESTLRVKTANAKAILVSCMVRSCVFVVAKAVLKSRRDYDAS